jgi:hypothetical protein
MKTDKINIGGIDYSMLIADEGKVIVRIHDEFVFDGSPVLGVDFSTGVARTDKQEYYKEIDAPAKVEPNEV